VSTRVQVRGQRGLTGTLIGYYAPLPSGTRNANIRWDRPELVLTVHESQIEVITDDN
jgi:hypothetical protein